MPKRLDNLAGNIKQLRKSRTTFDKLLMIGLPIALVDVVELKKETAAIKTLTRFEFSLKQFTNRLIEETKSFRIAKGGFVVHTLRKAFLRSTASRKWRISASSI